MELIIVIPTPRVFMPIPAFAQSKACFSEPSLVGIADLCLVIVVGFQVSVKGWSIVQSIAAGCVDVCVCVCLFVSLSLIRCNLYPFTYDEEEEKSRPERKEKQEKMWLYYRVERENYWLIIDIYSKMASCF